MKRLRATNAHDITAKDVGISLAEVLNGVFIHRHRAGIRTGRNDVIVDVSSADPTSLRVRTDGNKHFKIKISEITSFEELSK